LQTRRWPTRATDQLTENLSLSTKTFAILPGVDRNVLSSLCLTCQSLFLRPSVPTNVRLRLPLQGKTRHRFSRHCNHCALLQKNYVHASDLPWCSLISSDTSPTDWRLEKHGPQKYFQNAMRYMAAGSLGDSPFLEVDPKLDHQKRTSVSIRLNLHSNRSDANPCFAQRRQWVQTCMSEHKTCHQGSDNKAPKFLPTRLISVTGDPRLVVVPRSHHQDGTIRYTTVSHRWGQAKMPKLLRSNTKEMQIRIPSQYLTPTFRDAIIETRQLGFDYIWIDALCIIQDDLDD
jgi:hypothetical protein